MCLFYLRRSREFWERESFMPVNMCDLRCCVPHTKRWKGIEEKNDFPEMEVVVKYTLNSV